jgi:hypothetical protein
MSASFTVMGLNREPDGVRRGDMSYGSCVINYPR